MSSNAEMKVSACPCGPWRNSSCVIRDGSSRMAQVAWRRADQLRNLMRMLKIPRKSTLITGAANPSTNLSGSSTIRVLPDPVGQNSKFATGRPVSSTPADYLVAGRRSACNTSSWPTIFRSGKGPLKSRVSLLRMVGSN